MKVQAIFAFALLFPRGVAAVECVISKGGVHGFGREGIDPDIPEIARRTVEFFERHLAAPETR
jgi:hypothetical protein